MEANKGFLTLFLIFDKIKQNVMYSLIIRLLIYLDFLTKLRFVKKTKHTAVRHFVGVQEHDYGCQMPIIMRYFKQC